MLALKSIGLAALTLSAQVLSAPCQECDASSKVQSIYQFPNGTWVENLAVRRNNQLLVTILTTPDLYALDPQKPGAEPTLINTFPNSKALFGIAEIAPDVFAVAAGNYSIADGNTPGSYSIWKVDFSTCEDPSKPKISLIGPAPEADFVNGMCTLPKQPGMILLGDIEGGQILHMDTRTGAVSVVIPSTNKLVTSKEHPVFGIAGVDGIHVLDDELYAANVGKEFFGKIKINPDGTPAPGAKPVIIEHAAMDANEDDFALDKDGDAYLVTGSGNTIIEVRPNGKTKRIAGHLNSTEIAEPTSVALSRGRNYGKTLFVVTAGGLAAPINGDEIVGGQVLAIDLS